MSDWDTDEPLGYCRPPKWTRFKKGKSGNPRGRPKKSKQPEATKLSLQHEILRGEINRIVKVTEGGEVKEVTIQEAITKSQAAEAVKGSPLAQRDIVGRIEQLEATEAEVDEQRKNAERSAKAQEVEGKDRFFEYLFSLKKSQAKAWADAEVAERDEPDFPWPHPDDVMLDEGRKQYRLRGPMSAEEVPLCKFMRAARDTALARMTLAIRKSEGDQPSRGKIWAIFVRYYDVQLPKRWQLNADWGLAIEHLLSLTEGALEKEIERLDGEQCLRAKLAGLKDTSESYKSANDIMSPALALCGYRSLAQFQKAYEDTEGNPPWPRKPNRPNKFG